MWWWKKITLWCYWSPSSYVYMFLCVWWCSSIDGLGEWLHGDSDDDSPGWGRRETVWSLLAWRGILPLPHLWGVCVWLGVCVCLSWSVTMVCVSIRWTWFRSTSGAMTSWFVVSTWRTSRPRRPAHSPSSTSSAGLPRASPPPHAPYWTSAGTAWTLNAGLCLLGTKWGGKNGLKQGVTTAHFSFPFEKHFKTLHAIMNTTQIYRTTECLTFWGLEGILLYDTSYGFARPCSHLVWSHSFVTRQQCQFHRPFSVHNSL